MYEAIPGATSQSVQIFLRNATTTQPVTGLTAASAGHRAGYVRKNGTPVAVPLVALASPTAAWVSGGFVEEDPAIVPGAYRLDLPDAAYAAGVDFFTATIGFDNVVGEGVLVLLREPASTVGPGGYPYTVTVVTTSPLPIAGARAWVSTDILGVNVVAGTLVTDALGRATFLLGAGNYYLWVMASDYLSVGPTAFSVSAAGGQTVTLAGGVGPPALVAPTAHEFRTTAHDLTTRLLDFIGADPDEKNYRAVRRATLDAMREFAQVQKWAYLRSVLRLWLRRPYAEGMVSYDEAGGVWPRQVTLVGGVWPSWAGSASLKVGTLDARVDRRISDTVLTLRDVAFDGDLEPSAFTLYQDAYSLPADFVAGGDPQAETSWGELSYVPFHHFLAGRRAGGEVGSPRVWTVAGSPDLPGRMAVLVYPSPDAEGSLDIAYYKKPREVRVFDVTEGSCNVYPLDGTVVSFNTAVITPEMVGSVIRLASTFSSPPTDRGGLAPFAFEGTIVKVASATEVWLDVAAPVEYQNVSYRISDPIDVAESHVTLVGRAAEKHLAISRVLKNRGDAVAAYQDALQTARESDAQVSSRRHSQTSSARGRLLREMPLTF